MQYGTRVVIRAAKWDSVLFVISTQWKRILIYACAQSEHSFAWRSVDSQSPKISVGAERILLRSNCTENTGWSNSSFGRGHKVHTQANKISRWSANMKLANCVNIDWRKHQHWLSGMDAFSGDTPIKMVLPPFWKGVYFKRKDFAPIVGWMHQAIKNWLFRADIKQVSEDTNQSPVGTQR